MEYEKDLSGVLPSATLQVVFLGDEALRLGAVTRHVAEDPCIGSMKVCILAGEPGMTGHSFEEPCASAEMNAGSYLLHSGATSPQVSTRNRGGRVHYWHGLPEQKHQSGGITWHANL
eukprot:1464447-Amphidinium_carterae.1